MFGSRALNFLFLSTLRLTADPLQRKKSTFSAKKIIYKICCKRRKRKSTEEKIIDCVIGGSSTFDKIAKVKKETEKNYVA